MISKKEKGNEKIHPFSDGNGRTGRLIINFELMKAGYPICIIKNEDRLEYYESLNEAQANNNYDEIVKFVEESLEKTFEFYFDIFLIIGRKNLKNFVREEIYDNNPMLFRKRK